MKTLQDLIDDNLNKIVKIERKSLSNISRLKIGNGPIKDLVYHIPVPLKGKIAFNKTTKTVNGKKEITFTPK